MEALVNAVIATGLLLLLVLTIYLIDKVNSIERETRKMMSSMAEKSAPLADPFLGLSAKKLWDAMTGRATDGLDAQGLESLRQLYQVVLSKHIEALYQEGFKDGQRGMLAEPKNTRMINTAKGPVTSWMPSAQANALYQCGLKAAQSPLTDWGPIRVAMDEAGVFLFSKAQLDAGSPLSDWLMPMSPAAADVDAHAAMGQSDTPSDNKNAGL